MVVAKKIEGQKTTVSDLVEVVRICTEDVVSDV
jgi:hypothetical protein